MLLANVIKDYSQTVMLCEQQADHQLLDGLFAPLLAQATEELLQEGVGADRIELKPLLDMRYRGQSFELLVDYAEDFSAEFHRQHQRTYGYSSQGKPVEIVNLRLRAFGRPDHQLPQEQAKAAAQPAAAAVLGRTQTVFGGQWHETNIIDRSRLQHGNSFCGPAIITEYSSTIVLPLAWRCTVDPFGHLLLTRKEDEQ